MECFSSEKKSEISNDLQGSHWSREWNTTTPKRRRRMSRLLGTRLDKSRHGEESRIESMDMGWEREKQNKPTSKFQVYFHILYFFGFGKHKISARVLSIETWRSDLLCDWNLKTALIRSLTLALADWGRRDIAELRSDFFFCSFTFHFSSREKNNDWKLLFI